MNDDNTKAFTLNYLKENPDAAGWGTWYFLIGYSVMPDCQRLGFASEAVAGLIAWAFSHPEVVTAETQPALEASIRVLENDGFPLLGRGSEEGVIRYGIDRNQFEALC